MDLNLIKNSWDQASNKLSNHWAISIFKERKEDEKTILEADGIIYSPAGDIKRPYPVFYLDFKLTCTSSNNANEFSMTIKNLDPKVKPILNNSFRYFIPLCQLFYYRILVKSSLLFLSLYPLPNSVFPFFPKRFLSIYAGAKIAFRTTNH